MKILLLGSGGREHALAWKIAQSKKVDQLYIAPGNAGTGSVGENVPLKADDFEGIRQFVLSKGVDMVVVGPEDPLVKGVYDICNVEWRNACGENIAAGQATPEDVMKSWLSSAGHKANILSPEYTKMGLGYSNSGCGAGRYSHYWAQEFAG